MCIYICMQCMTSPRWYIVGGIIHDELRENVHIKCQANLEGRTSIREVKACLKFKPFRSEWMDYNSCISSNVTNISALIICFTKKSMSITLLTKIFSLGFIALFRWFTLFFQTTRWLAAQSLQIIDNEGHGNKNDEYIKSLVNGPNIKKLEINVH